jgi:hypothetical protein
LSEKVIDGPFVGCTSTPVTVMKTDWTPANDVGASVRPTFRVELGAVAPLPPQAASAASEARARPRRNLHAHRLNMTAPVERSLTI